MKNKYGHYFCALLCLGMTQVSIASELEICVYDVMGANGDMMSVSKDYSLAARQWGVQVTPKVYTNMGNAISDFEKGKCQGLVADNFLTRKYNNFLGTVGAVGAIPNTDIGLKILYALGSPKLASKMKNKNHEVIGYFPFGIAYFFVKDRNANSLEKLNGKKIGILAVDPSQRRMAQKVGMIPVPMTYDDAASKFRRGDFEIFPAPLLVYKPFEIDKIIGANGGVLNYPLAFMTMNFIISNPQAYPADFGQKSRHWFSQRAPQSMKTLERWESAVPKSIFFDIPDIDQSSYDRLISQMRKEFIDNKTYDSSMIALIMHLRCNQDSKFIECQKK